MAKITRRPLPKSKATTSKRAKKSRNGPLASQGRQKIAKKPAAKSGQPRGLKKSLKAGKSWTSAEIYEAFSRFRKANPEPKGELEHLNPYTLLVAVVLSAQATDAGVTKTTPASFERADTPQKMLALGEERVRDY